MNPVTKTAIENASANLRVALGSEKRAVSPGAAGMSKKETREWSILKIIRAVVDNRWGETNCLELEVDQTLSKRHGAHARQNSIWVPEEIQERTITVANSASLVGGQNVGFIDVLRRKSVAYKMGADDLKGLVGNVTLPTGVASLTQATMANETTGAAESENTFGQIVLTPKTIEAYTKLSRLLALQSSPQVEGIIFKDLAQTNALAIDTLAITQILAASGTAAVSGTTLGLAGVVGFQSAIATANACPDPATFGYAAAVNVGVLLKNRSTFGSSGYPVWAGSLLDGQIEGCRAISSNQIPASTMIGGDWADLLIGNWGVLEISIDPFTDFKSGIVGIGCFQTIDVALRHAQSFAIATSIT